MTPARTVSDAPDDAARRRRYHELFTATYEPVQRYVRRRASAADVDDVVAETMTVLWRRLDDVPDDAPIAWALGVARRCLANQRRGDGRRVRLVDRLRRAPVENADPADVVAAGDPVLHEALARLSDDDREIVRLWAWEQLPPREVAVVLDISPNAAALRVSRARSRLAEAVAAVSGGGGQDVAASGHSRDGNEMEVDR